MTHGNCPKIQPQGPEDISTSWPSEAKGVSRETLFSESPQSRHALRGTRHRVSQPRAALKSKTGFKRTAAYLVRNLGATTEILRKPVSRLEIWSFQPFGGVSNNRSLENL